MTSWKFLYVGKISFSCYHFLRDIYAGEVCGMERKVYGYIRVSTKEQNEDRQIIAMKEFGVLESNMIIEKESGKNFDRPNYQRLVRKLHAGDVLVVKSIDRLGRNYTEILEQWRYIAKDIQADIVVLDMPLLDTRKNKDLTGTLIADIVLQLLSYVAETERESIRQRQREGIEAAKRKGVQFGRPRLPRIEGYREIIREWEEGKITGKAAAERLGCSRACLYKWAEQEREPGYVPPRFSK